MTTPGFTAEASLARARGHYRQVPLAPVAAAEFLALAQLGLPDVLSTAQPVARRIDRHGNWCGIGHSGPGPPIDAVDEVCCRHDQCYCEDGYLECKCDRDLVAAMPGAIADSDTTAEARAYGLAAIALFTVSPCVCWREVCYPWPGWPPYRCSDVPVPGLPGLKIC
jgi:hypothetical protein